MRRRQFVCQLTSLTGGVAALGLGGCGTIFHQERIDQPRSRDIDWEVAALDGLGLVFFFVPGVIAFIVDFYTGAIYLPPGGSSANSPEQLSPEQWQPVKVAPAELRPDRIEHIVGTRLARPLSLHDSQTRISALPELGLYARQCQRHQSDSSYGMTSSIFFQKAAGQSSACSPSSRRLG